MDLKELAVLYRESGNKCRVQLLELEEYLETGAMSKTERLRLRREVCILGGMARQSQIILKTTMKGKRLTKEGDSLDRNREYQALRQFIRLIDSSDTDSMAQKVADAVAHELTPRQRELVRLYYIDQATMYAIAEELRLSVSTVSRTLKRARGRLKKYLPTAAGCCWRKPRTSPERQDGNIPPCPSVIFVIRCVKSSRKEPNYAKKISARSRSAAGPRRGAASGGLRG